MSNIGRLVAAILLGFFVSAGFLVSSYFHDKVVAAEVLASPSVWMAPGGNDTTCVRLDASKPCATFNRAYQIAQASDSVAVSSGSYGSSSIAGPGKTALVTYVCADGGDVTFQNPNFGFDQGASNVTFQGGCFRFHVVHFGWGSAAAVTSKITLDGVHMASYECAGCADVTIRNSEVGPAVACYAPGTTGNGGNGYPIPQSAWCDPAKPDEAYWATLPAGSSDQQMEPFIHNNYVPVYPKNFQVINSRVHGMQTKDSANLHTGGLQLWNVDGLTIIGNRWDHNAIYDILSNGAAPGDSFLRNTTIENNVFGQSFQPIGNTIQGETPRDYREITLTDQLTNVKIRNNSFAHGLDIRPSSITSNVRVVGNIMGIYSTCPILSGLVYSRNTTVGDNLGCGDQGRTDAAWPYVSYTNVDFHLAAGVKAIDGADPADFPSTDIEGNNRPVGAGPDTGAYEYGSSSGGGTSTTSPTTTTAPTTTATTPVHTTTATTTTAPATTTAPPPPRDCDTPFQEFEDQLVQGNLWRSYARQNPAEASAIRSWYADIRRIPSHSPPAVSTYTGRAFIQVGVLYQACVS